MRIERRKCPRINISCDVTVVFAERILVFHAHTENLGCAGIKVVLEEKLREGLAVGIELFPSNKQKPLECKGQIKWVRQKNKTEEKKHSFETGINFLDMSSSFKEELKKLAKS